MCNSTHVANGTLLLGESRIACEYGCSETIVSPISYVCTCFSITDDWSFGDYHTTHLFNSLSDENTVTIGTVSSAWISEAGSRWNVSTTFSLVTRADTGKINSSPRIQPTPPLRLQHGCSYTIPLPVSDPDNDTIRCRWAVNTECSSICNKFPGAFLDSATCTITYTAVYGIGIKAVAIMIEDYAPGSLHRPLSSVALQFLILVYSSAQPCATQSNCLLPITLNSLNVSVDINKNSTLTCKANGTLETSYYWEKQNGNIPVTSTGLRSNTFTLINVQLEDAGRYRCVAFDCSNCKRSFSHYVTVTVNGKLLFLCIFNLNLICILVPRPVFVLHPSSQNISLTQTATFACIATGYNVSYQWRIGSGSFPSKVTGINSNTLVIPNVRSSDKNTYICVVSNQQVSISSKAATLMVAGTYIYTYVRMYSMYNFY